MSIRRYMRNGFQAAATNASTSIGTLSTAERPTHGTCEGL
jgi:hypothetical protein